MSTTSIPANFLFKAFAKHAKEFPNKPAIIDSNGQYTYNQLLHAIAAYTIYIREIAPKRTIIPFLAPSSFEYVVIFFSIMAADCVVLPLCLTHPNKEREYYVNDSEAKVLIASPSLQNQAEELSRMTDTKLVLFKVSSHPYKISSEAFDANQISTIIYTSGTTSRPKGSLQSYDSMKHGISSLGSLWRISSSDSVYHVLPLHHGHGVNLALLNPLVHGATVEFARFSPEEFYTRFSRDSIPSIFMAVPTIYIRLIKYSESHEINVDWSKVRLMTVGSASLPRPFKTKWREMTGQRLLERYGTTETGIILSAGYEQDKRPDGAVGWIVPGVQIRLVGEGAPNQGEIEVRSKGLFQGYWKREQATKDAYTRDGWYKTGDVAIINPDGSYTLQGRASVDIIKSKAYKISALEIEREMLAFDYINEVAVVGIEDEDEGQKIAAVVVSSDPNLTLERLRFDLKKSMASYKCPTVLKLVNEIPKNAMGKVNKKILVENMFSHKAKL